MCISLYWSLYSAIPLGPAQVLPSPSRSLLRHLFDSPVCAYLLSHFWFPWFLTLCDPMNHSPPGSSVHGDSPGKSIGLGSHSLLQGIFLTQGLSPCLRHCRQSLVCGIVGRVFIDWTTGEALDGPAGHLFQKSPHSRPHLLPSWSVSLSEGAEMPGKYRLQRQVSENRT